MNKLLIKYEPVNSLNITTEYDIHKGYIYVTSKYTDNYLENVRFIGWTAVGKIEDGKLYIAFAVCKYEEGDKFVKKEGVKQALAKCTPEKANIIVELKDIPENETVKVFHGYVDNYSQQLEKRFYKKRVKYWLSKVK